MAMPLLRHRELLEADRDISSSKLGDLGEDTIVLISTTSSRMSRALPEHGDHPQRRDGARRRALRVRCRATTQQLGIAQPGERGQGQLRAQLARVADLFAMKTHRR